MRFALVFVTALGALTARAAADCPKTPRLVIDPPGKRHSLPQLTFDGKAYQLVGYDGPPTSLVLTSFDLGKRTPKSVEIGAGGVAATATNGSQLAVAYLGSGAILPRSSDDKITRKGELEYLVLDGREVYAPTKERYQSFFVVVDAAGKQIVKPLPLGDQRVMHTAPGVQIAWNPRDKEWGVVWSEFNKLVFGRLSPTGKLLSSAPVVVDGFVQSSSRMLWTGSAFAFLAASPKGLTLYEASAAGVKPTPVAIESGALEPVLGFANNTFAIAYRITKPGTRAQLAIDKKAAPEKKPVPMRPPNEVPIPDEYILRLATVAGGKTNAPVTLASVRGGALLETPVIAADGAQWVVAWGQRVTSKVGFDDRLLVTRVDSAGKHAAGYPHRIDSEDVHQGYASIAGTGCDLAVSYVLGDPNYDVRVGVVLGRGEVVGAGGGCGRDAGVRAERAPADLQRAKSSTFGAKRVSGSSG